MVGRSDLLEVNKEQTNWKSKTINLEKLLFTPKLRADQKTYKHQPQMHEYDQALDWTLVESAQAYFINNQPVKTELPIRSIDRSVGALLSNEISKKYGAEGVPEGALHFKFRGSAGQSFGAFSTKGVHLELEGEGNDYFGKGLSGATLSVYPDRLSDFVFANQIIIGNVALYGATSGKLFIRGKAGERFAVRNSGASTVVEGIGDHGCEYMTGGTVVILGKTGRNFAAGMSGGIAYVLDEENKLQTGNNPDLIFDKFSAHDKRVLNGLMREHYERTGSITAQNILIYWKETLAKFKKVIPKTYKEILESHEEKSNKTVIRKIS